MGAYNSFAFGFHISTKEDQQRQVICTSGYQSIESRDSKEENNCIEEIEIPISVEVIKAFAFYNCSSLKRIEIPYRVSNIVDGAFLGCKSLKEILVAQKNDRYYDKDNGVLFLKTEITQKRLRTTTVTKKDELVCYPAGKNESVYEVSPEISVIHSFAFAYSKLKEIILPEHCFFLGKEVFMNCIHLENVKLPPKMSVPFHREEPSNGIYYSETPPKCIFEYEKYSGLFKGCSSLKTICVPQNWKKIPPEMFKNSGLEQIEIPNGVESISVDAFEDCKSLRSVTLPDSLKEIIGFAGCEKLEDLTFPNSLIKIGEKAFLGCLALKSIVIPEGTTEIDEDAFSGCISLETIELPSSISSIGYNAFANCISLKKVICKRSTPPKIIPSKCSDKENTPQNPLFKGVNTNNCILDVSSTAAFSYYNNPIFSGFQIPNLYSSKTQVVFYNGQTKIDSGDYFRSAIKNVNLPNTIQEIGEKAFSQCLNLTTIYLPSSITYIGRKAFECDENVIEIRIAITSPDKVIWGNDIFKGVNKEKCILYVPFGCASTYREYPAFREFKNIKTDKSL